MIDFINKKILIVGGAGFVGSNLTKMILKKHKPKKVIVVDNLSEDDIEEMIKSKEPYFLEVVVEKEANVFPMIPTGSSVSEIRLS